MTSIDDLKECYQCDKPVAYLFADSRCADCARLSISDVQGHDAYGECDDEQDD